MPENALINKCQTGDARAFEQLLGMHYDTIYRFAYRWSGDQHNAEDITQLSCIKLARSIAQFKGESSFTSWLYRLVINCAKDFYKSPNQHNRREESDEYACDEASTSISDKSERQFYAQQILEHINELKEDLKETLILVYGTGLSHSDAAKRLGIKESTVSWRVHEARRLLKATFTSSSLDSKQIAPARGAL